MRAATGSLVIARLPALSMRIDPRLRYVGAFPFDIRGIAGGYRYIWAEVDAQGRARRVFIVQREGYYARSHGRYSYPADNPQVIGGETYGHNVFIYDNDRAFAGGPPNEAFLTKMFMARHDIDWGPHLIMSRYARIVDPDGQNEIIFFYFEPLAAHTTKSYAEMRALGRDAPEVAAILAAVDANSRRAFSIGPASVR